ncbi:MAG TPA: hypothetical protein VFH27_09490, partial [Longimicrobiaceae bacterium]|nr:hypothetical protein [Longimicrobiaceae bacterium]
ADTESDIWPDPVDRSNVRLSEVVRLLAEYHKARGAYPATMAEGLPPVGQRAIDYERDAWGTGFRYRRSEDGYELRSAGADHRFDTPDDLVVTHLRQRPERQQDIQQPSPG